MKKTEKLDPDFYFNLPLEELISELEILKNRYSHYSNLRFDRNYNYDSAVYDLVGDREETEQEISNRKVQEEKSLQAHKDRVRKEAEKLGLL